MESHLACPRDGIGTTLEPHSGRRGQFTVDVCTRCDGEWFDKGEIAKLTGDADIERLLVDYAAGPSEFACPRCGNGMAVRPVGRVTVDVCTKCRGAWFDRGELESVAGSLASEETLSGTGLLSGGIGHWEALTLAAFASPRMLKKLLEPRKSAIPPPDRI